MKNRHHNNRKSGFTLMEVLIAVAIIAVLVSVAVPSFNTEKTREAADISNIETACKKVRVNATLDNLDELSETVKLEQKENDWQTPGAEDELSTYATEIQKKPTGAGNALIQWNTGTLKIIFDGAGGGGGGTATYRFSNYGEAVASGTADEKSRHGYEAVGQNYQAALKAGLESGVLMKGFGQSTVTDASGNVLGYYIATNNSVTNYSIDGQKLEDYIMSVDPTTDFYTTARGERKLGCTIASRKSDKILFDASGNFIGVAVSLDSGATYDFYAPGSDKPVKINSSSVVEIYKAALK